MPLQPEELGMLEDIGRMLADGNAGGARAALSADALDAKAVLAGASGVEGAKLPDLQLGSDAAAIDQLNNSHWLTFGSPVQITASSGGDPIFRVTYGDGTSEVKQFTLAQKALTPLSQETRLPTTETSVAHDLQQNQWHTVNGDGYKMKVTQFSNKGPLFVITDEADKELARVRVDAATKGWRVT